MRSTIRLFRRRFLLRALRRYFSLWGQIMTESKARLKYTGIVFSRRLLQRSLQRWHDESAGSAKLTRKLWKAQRYFYRKVVAKSLSQWAFVARALSRGRIFTRHVITAFTSQRCQRVLMAWYGITFHDPGMFEAEMSLARRTISRRGDVRLSSRSQVIRFTEYLMRRRFISLSRAISSWHARCVQIKKLANVSHTVRVHILKIRTKWALNHWQEYCFRLATRREIIWHAQQISRSKLLRRCLGTWMQQLHNRRMEKRARDYYRNSRIIYVFGK